MNYRQGGDPLSTDAAVGAGDAGLSLHEAASGVGRGGEDRVGGRAVVRRGRPRKGRLEPSRTAEDMRC